MLKSGLYFLLRQQISLSQALRTLLQKLETILLRGFGRLRTRQREGVAEVSGQEVTNYLLEPAQFRFNLWVWSGGCGFDITHILGRAAERLLFIATDSFVTKNRLTEAVVMRGLYTGGQSPNTPAFAREVTRKQQPHPTHCNTHNILCTYICMRV